MSQINILKHFKTGDHIWSFSTVGGVKRVNLESGQDLVHLAELDPKLWTALSCPVNGLEIDKATLQIVDSDKDDQAEYCKKDTFLHDREAPVTD